MVVMPTEGVSEYDPTLGEKFVFVTGGVMSGLGKGITAASTGRLLANAGFDVTAVKIDPYLNVDAGTMNPYQHGEVYVLKDGGEVDLDLGNYERFLNVDMTSDHNVTTGKVYKEVIENERAGDYLGKTVQIIPHVTDDFKRRIREAAEGHDVCIVEVGGTVGDIEGMPYLEALRQFSHEQDEEDLLFVHVTLVPYSKNGEQKTKPTQHSVKELRSIGLQPDVLVGRCDDRLDPETKEKIALFCDVPNEAVFSNPDVEDIYHVPLVVEEEGLDRYVMERLGLSERALPPAERDNSWRELVTRETTVEVDVALVGKYALEDAYISIHEALKHAGLERGVDVNVLWVDADEMTDEHERNLQRAGGSWSPAGSAPAARTGRSTPSATPGRTTCRFWGSVSASRWPSSSSPGTSSATRARTRRRSTPTHPIRSSTSSPSSTRSRTWAGRCGSAPTRRASSRGRSPTNCTGATPAPSATATATR